MIRLKELREETGVLQKEISSELSIERSLYGKYENGRSEPPYDVLIRLADYFGVSLDYLLGRTDVKNPVPLTEIGNREALTEPETDLLGSFRKLNAEGQTAALAMLRGFAAAPEYKKDSVLSKVQSEIG